MDQTTDRTRTVPVLVILSTCLNVIALLSVSAFVPLPFGTFVVPVLQLIGPLASIPGMFIVAVASFVMAFMAIRKSNGVERFKRWRTLARIDRVVSILCILLALVFFVTMNR